MNGFTSIPFKTESGLSSVNGVAKFSTAGIVLEFESKLFGMIGTGVKENQIMVLGFGPSKPIADNSTKQGRSANRRVELHIDVPQQKT